jgi:phospholipase C
MLTTNRRTFLRFLSSAAAIAALPHSIDRALAIPASRLAGHLENGRDSVSDPALGIPQS